MNLNGLILIFLLRNHNLVLIIFYLEVERLLYDVIPFAVLCILPTKLIGFRKNIENARRYANYIG